MNLVTKDRVPKKSDDFVYSFEDIKQLLKRALDSPKGIKIGVESKQKARNLVQRFNTYRARDRQNSMKLYPPEHLMYGSSIYDSLIFKVKEGHVELVKSSGDWFEVEEL